MGLGDGNVGVGDAVVGLGVGDGDTGGATAPVPNRSQLRLTKGLPSAAVKVKVILVDPVSARLNGTVTVL